MLSRVDARKPLLIAGPLALLVLALALWPRSRADEAGGAGFDGRGEGAPGKLAPLDPDTLDGASLGSLRKVAENTELELYLDPDTTKVAVKHKRDGTIWHSNPPEREKIERIARGDGLKQLGAQFTMGYYRQQRSESLDHPTMLMKHIKANNRMDSVDYGQFELYRLPAGVRIEYLVGKAWDYEDYLPRLIDGERFERLILSRIDGEEDRRTLLENYIPVTFVRETEDNRIVVADLDQDKLFNGYTLIPLNEEYRQKAARLAAMEGSGGEEPSFEREQLNNMRRTIIMDFIHTITENRRGGIGLNQLGPEDFAGFRDRVVYYLNTPPKFLQIEMAEIIKETRYSPEDVQEDCRRNGIDGPVPDPGVFKIPLEYSLDGASLVVRIPCREISYPRDVVIEGVGELNEKVTFPLESIGVLPYFGAAGPERTGEIFVPDGAGALIYLNNGKTNAGGYVAPVYGRDNSLEPKRSERLKKKQIHLPVFGMRQGDRGFLGIIEDGAALAKIRAEVAGRINSFNTVSAEFTVMPVAAVGFGAVSVSEVNVANEEEGVSTIHPKRLYQGDIKIRYLFLQGPDAGYVGMAGRYREYLMRTKGLTRLTPSAGLPFFLELVGSIPVRKPVMGVNKEVMEPLTTFAQARRIARELLAGGVNSLKLEFNGLFRGGVEHDYPARVRLAGELGGGRELAGLSELERKGSRIYPRINLMHVYRTNNGFNKNADAARYLNKLPAKVYDYNLATCQIESGTGRFIVSPARLGRLVERFIRGFRRFSLKGLSLGLLGSELNADYRENERDLLDRQQALARVFEQFQALKGGGLDLLAHGANDYALPYVRNIIGAPMESSRDNIFDEEVPFYQIALHGLVNMAGDPLNLSADCRQSFLRSLETGSCLHYRWFYRESSAVKDTRYADLYACHYRDWLAEAVRWQREAESALASLQDQMIVGHERLMEGVYRTTYENGRAVLVNYGDRAVSVDGITVEARGYALR